MKINAETPSTELLNIAKATLAELEPGEVFFLRQLFRGFEWGRLPQRTRIALGNAFFFFAQGEEGLAQVEILGKTAQGQQKYRKR